MAQFFNYSHEAKVGLLFCQRLFLCPESQKKQPASQRYGGYPLKLKRDKFPWQSMEIRSPHSSVTFCPHVPGNGFWEDLLFNFPRNRGETDPLAVFLAASYSFLRMNLTLPFSHSLGTFHNHHQLSETIESSLTMTSTSAPSNTSHVCPSCFRSPSTDPPLLQAVLVSPKFCY